jgi:glycosyltransferase involved in cell wall biosynthesis
LVLISVVIPVYKADDCLIELYRRIKSSLGLITRNYEIILVEDCGGDNSWPIIKELSKKDPRVKGIQFSRNFGQHYGITAGLDYSNGRWVIVMDCDLQDRPEEIPRLYNKAKEGYDIVVAKRKNRKHAIMNRFASYLFYKVFSFLTDINYDGEVGNFRIISRKVTSTFCGMREQLRFFGGHISWMGFKTASIEVEHSKRHSGSSSYSYSKLFKLAFDTIIAFSDKPLRISVRLGFLISTFSFFWGSYIFYNAITKGSNVLGWSSLMVSIFFIGGIIITNLGVIGIYLGKIYEEAKNRPLYIVNSTTFDK